ncbi:MAG: NifU N-terminal domain-containing protein [Bacteroidota bacterium]
MTITVCPTPNPNSLKFDIAGGSVIERDLLAFHSAREASDNPLGASLFALEGVASLLILPSFVTVTKHPDASWDPLAENVEQVLVEHVAP